MVAKKTSDMRSQRNGKKKPIEVHVWIHFKFVLDQPHSFSQPTAVNEGAGSQPSIPIPARSFLECS